MGKPANYDQDSFRYRDDDGSESGATWKYTANNNGDLDVDTNYRMRFLIQETNGGDGADVDFEFQYNLGGAGWNNITTSSSVIKAVTSTHFTNGDDCTQQVGSGGTFLGNNDGMTEDGTSGGANLDFTSGAESETELCFQIVSGDVADNNTIQIRLTRDSGTVLESYTNTPSISVNEPGNSPITGTATLTFSETGVLKGAGSLKGNVDFAFSTSGAISCNPLFKQDSFRFRDDDGSESGATWLEIVNTNISADMDTNIRLRFLIQETASGSEEEKVFFYQFRINAGAWAIITNSGAVIAGESIHYSHGDDTTQQLGSGTYITENDGMHSWLAGATTGGVLNDFAGHDEEETEICFQINSGVASPGDELEFRTIDGAENPLDAYGSVPKVTVNSANSQITGTVSFSFDESGVLKGAGELAGSSDLSFTESGVLAGKGSLAGDTSLDFTESAILGGIGGLIGTSDLDFTTSGAITGAGALVGSADMLFSEAGILAGTGAIAGTSAFNFSTSGDLTEVSSGAITGSATFSFTESADLKGSGVLAGSSDLLYSVSGVIKGKTSLLGSTTLEFYESAALSGKGSLVGGTSFHFTESGSIAGAGALAGAVDFDFSTTGNLTSSTGGAISGQIDFAFTGAGDLKEKSEAIDGEYGKIARIDILSDENYLAIISPRDKINIMSDENKIDLVVTYRKDVIFNILEGVCNFAFSEAGGLKGTGKLSGESVFSFSGSGNLIDGTPLYVEDFSGPSESMENRDWTEVDDYYGNFEFRDYGDYGLIKKTGGAPFAGSARYRYDGAGAAAWDDYDFSFNCHGSFKQSATGHFNWIVHHETDDSDYIECKHEWVSDSDYRLIIDGTNSANFPGFDDGDTIRTRVTVSGTDVTVTVYQNEVERASKIIDASSRSGILNGSIGAAGLIYNTSIGCKNIIVERVY